MKLLTARQQILKEFLDRVWSSGEIDQCDPFSPTDTPSKA